MLEAFSRPREYDYIRLDGLSRVTGRPAHEWDIYILKELIDNALDADEVLWSQDLQQIPTLHIQVKYINAPQSQDQEQIVRCQQLLVHVENRAPFPTELIKSIFATQWYTSRKAFIKSLTRGTLGNALKTLLGIPYALHNRLTGDWEPDLKPLSICCRGTEYLPRYVVDTTTQTVEVNVQEEPCKFTIGTRVSVRLDYFEQQEQRKLIDIQRLAQQYHLCNPHAQFHWKIEIKNDTWIKEYLAEPNWSQKFLGVGPIHWYSLTDFRDLLGELHRETYTNQSDSTLPLETICHYFTGVDAVLSKNQIDTSAISSITKTFSKDFLTKDDINGATATELFKILGNIIPTFDSLALGFIGAEHIQAVLTSIFAVNGKVHYNRITATEIDLDTGTPFVIEVAAVLLTEKEAPKDEGKRQVWTAINFSPTYNDPFLSHWLRTTARPGESVLGLRGVLEAYNIREETAFLLFVHLICPTLEHTEFSKTEINSLLFEKSLSKALDHVLIAVRDAQDEEKLMLEKTIFTALDDILGRLGEHERFVYEQLIEQLRLQLSLDQRLVSWLNRPETVSSLRTYIDSYLSVHPYTSSYLTGPVDAIMHLPSHPQSYFFVPIEQIFQEVLEQQYINKILYLQQQFLEPAFIVNNWLCRMDMALLHAPTGSAALEDAFARCMHLTRFPFLILHSQDEEGQHLVEHLRTLLAQQGIPANRLIALSLPGTLMPHDLFMWLVEQFAKHGIAVKYMPARSQVRKDIAQRFDQLLQEHIVDDLTYRFRLPDFLIELDNKLSYARAMQEEALDEKLSEYLNPKACAESYGQALDTILKRFFERFLVTQNSVIQQTTFERLRDTQG